MLAENGETNGPFVDWNTAQFSFLSASRAAQQEIVDAIQKSGMPARSLTAPLRPLGNVTNPAVAVELAPTKADVSQLSAADFQQNISAALANGIAQFLSNPERVRERRGDPTPVPDHGNASVCTDDCHVGICMATATARDQIPSSYRKNRARGAANLGPMETVTVYVAYDSPGELRAQSISIPLAAGRQQRAEGLLRGLMGLYTAKDSTHPLAAGAEIRHVFLVDPGLAVIDVNSAFVEGQVSGVLAEELTIASLVQTLATNMPGLTRVKILVDGNERETLAGHADLTGFYDVLQIAKVVKELCRAIRRRMGIVP